MRKRSATPAPSDARSTRTMSSRTIRWRQATRSRSSHRSPGAETMAVRVQEQDFDLGAELAALTAGNHRIGGLGGFVGVARDIAGGPPVVDMTLAHYPGLTEHQVEAAGRLDEGRVGAKRGSSGR